MGGAKSENDDGSPRNAAATTDGRPTADAIVAPDDADEAAGNAANSDPDEGDDDATSVRAARRTPSSSVDVDGSPARRRPPPPKSSSATTTSAIASSSSSSRPSLRRAGSSSFGQSFRDLRGTLQRQTSSLVEGVGQSLPTTPGGWALLTLGAASVGLQYELHVQKELTAPPIVFCQNSSASGRGTSVLNGRMDRIFDKLSRSQISDENGEGAKEGILSRTVTPSLFIGTRGLMSSTAAYALGGGKSKRRVKSVREVVKMGADGALIVLDWEIPLSATDEKNASSPQQQQQQSTGDVTKVGGIDKPVVLLVHGMNNDSTFGYVRSMMRTATDRGWIAVCMNLRGQDGTHQVKNNTPRGYNAGYTGDLRGVVQQLERRLKKREPAERSSSHDDDDRFVGGPIFLLGYSLGANIVTKYLGEESLHGTLPKYIGGGAAMGNPLHIHSGTIHFPWNVLLGAGVKRSLLQNFHTFKRHHEPGFQRAMKKALLSPTIGRLDDAAAPYVIRNDTVPPYTPRIGYKDGEDYWHDSSSHRYVGHVSVPLLKITAQDDFLVFGQFARKLNHCLENPNVLVVKTRCGGHLGWQESPPPGRRRGEGSGSWSDVAVADFIEALLQVREEDRRRRMKEEGKAPPQRSSPKVLSKL